MIQRIQTIYLLVAAILMAVTVFSPLLFFKEGLILFSYGIKEGTEIIKPTYGIVSMAALSSLLSLVAVFIFKNRKRQKKVSQLTASILVFYYVTVIVYLASYMDRFYSTISGITFGIILPFIALILVILAVRRINKDEKLVRSLDRIR